MMTVTVLILMTNTKHDDDNKLDAHKYDEHITKDRKRETIMLTISSWPSWRYQKMVMIGPMINHYLWLYWSGRWTSTMNMTTLLSEKCANMVTIHDHDDEHHSHDVVNKHHNNDNAPDADDREDTAVMILDIVMTMIMMIYHTMMTVLLTMLEWVLWLFECVRKWKIYAVPANIHKPMSCVQTYSTASAQKGLLLWGLHCCTLVG